MRQLYQIPLFLYTRAPRQIRRNRGSVAPRRTAIPDSSAAILPPHCSVAERRSPPAICDWEISCLETRLPAASQCTTTDGQTSRELSPPRGISVTKHWSDEKQNDSCGQNTPTPKEDSGESNQYANGELSSTKNAGNRTRNESMYQARRISNDKQGYRYVTK